jgi:hypothetical protein
VTSLNSLGSNPLGKTGMGKSALPVPWELPVRGSPSYRMRSRGSNMLAIHLHPSHNQRSKSKEVQATPLVPNRKEWKAELGAERCQTRTLPNTGTNTAFANAEASS